MVLGKLAGFGGLAEKFHGSEIAGKKLTLYEYGSGSSLFVGTEAFMISNQLRRRLFLTSILLSTFSTTGCLVLPIKTGTHIQNPTGEKDTLPKFAIVPGQTTRGQVEEQYKAFAVDSGVPNLFWARFRKSTWAMFWGVGGYGGAAAGGGRMWGAFNLLVRFDQNGTVASSDVVQDKDLLARLRSLCAEKDFPALDLSQPTHVNGVQVYVLNSPVEFQLTEGTIMVRRYLPDRKVHKRWVPQPPVIASFSSRRMIRPAPNVSLRSCPFGPSNSPPCSACWPRSPSLRSSGC